MQEDIWWGLIALPAGSVLGLVANTILGTAWLLTRWHEIPRHKRGRTAVAAALLAASVLCIPATITTYLTTDVDLQLAVAFALSLAYLLWNAAYAVSATLPPKPG